MKKRSLCALALATTMLATSSCSSGPHKLRRGWEDYTNQKYTESSWIHGALLQDVLPVYPLVTLVMGIGDWLIVNPYYFWSQDAWDGKGTGFDHVALEGAEKSVGTWMGGDE